MNYAYVTLATTKRYLTQALLLHYSLKRFNSQYPLIIMIPQELEEFILDTKDFNIKYKIINLDKFENENEPIFLDTINKFQACNFLNYDKLLFLDADIFLLENIDNIFKDFLQYKFSIENYSFGDPCGCMIIMTHTENLYYKFKNNYNKNIIYDDEKAIKYYFNDLFIRNHDLWQKYYNKIFHDSGCLYKLSDFLNQLAPDCWRDYLKNFSDKEYFQLIKDWQGFKSKVIDVLIQKV